MVNDEINMVNSDALQEVTGGALPPEELEKKTREYDDAIQFFSTVSAEAIAFITSYGKEKLFSEWGAMWYSYSAKAFLKMMYFMKTGKTLPWI